MSSTLFEKICAGEIPADIVYQDDQCVCFRDIGPQAPTHLLLVPRKPIPRLSLADEGDGALLGHMMLAAGKIARSLGIDESGFRLVINNGPDAGEAVPHLHMHILAGRKLEWPPGEAAGTFSLSGRRSARVIPASADARAALSACQVRNQPVRCIYEKIAGRT